MTDLFSSMPLTLDNFGTYRTGDGTDSGLHLDPLSNRIVNADGSCSGLYRDFRSDNLLFNDNCFTGLRIDPITSTIERTMDYNRNTHYINELPDLDFDYKKRKSSSDFLDCYKPITPDPVYISPVLKDFKPVIPELSYVPPMVLDPIFPTTKKDSTKWDNLVDSYIPPMVLDPIFPTTKKDSTKWDSLVDSYVLPMVLDPIFPTTKKDSTKWDSSVDSYVPKSKFNNF